MLIDWTESIKYKYLQLYTARKWFTILLRNKTTDNRKKKETGNILLTKKLFIEVFPWTTVGRFYFLLFYPITIITETEKDRKK